MQLININTEKCTSCMNCVRVCPVRAIVITVGKMQPSVDNDRCFGCGLCIKSCPSQAVTYRDSVGAVLEMLNTGEKLAAMVDPAISAEFPDVIDYRKFVEMIRSLGFTFVNEVSFGVDLLAEAHRKLFDDNRGKYYITASCPAIVNFIEKYYPDLIGNLIPLVTPAIATAKVVRAVHGKDMKVVYIGPCIAAKLESELRVDDTTIDEVLTFTELRQLFEIKGIRENQVEFSDFDPPAGNYGSLFGISSGILHAIGVSENIPDGIAITEDGNQGSLKAVASFEQHVGLIQRHFNLFFDEGCITGPGMTNSEDKFIKLHHVVKYFRKRTGNLDYEMWKSRIDHFQTIDLKRTFENRDCRLPEPPAARITEILTLLGKSEQTGNDGCSLCGFESCREFATAVARGITRTDMCMDYNLRNKSNYISTLRASNKQLLEEIEGLKQEQRSVKEDYDIISDKLETTKYILNQIPSGVVIVDEKLRILSSNRSFVELLGNEAKEIDEIIPGLRGADLKTLVPVHFYKVFQNVLATNENILSKDVSTDESVLNLSVFSIRKNKIAGGIVRDMYSPEVLNEQTIQRVTDAIDQNLGMVQQIGFLLGEGASKTEAMLNSVIRIHQHKKEKK